ncbi:MAG: Crp/Fnr family transcriptional regulator [Eubacteriales bacterium]
MFNSNIFKDIDEQEREKMFNCFGSTSRKYSKGETVAHISGEFNRVGILIDGQAHIMCIDFDGHVSILEHLEAGGVFGEMFSLPMENFAFTVVADSDCEVRYMDYPAIVQPCGNICEHHCQLINNLFHMTACKSRRLALHINVLSRRTTREKLLTYFQTLCAMNGSPKITLPISYTALADYLCVDRSAMMRELKKIKDAGLILVCGREITFVGE